MKPLLEVKNLTKEFRTSEGILRAVNQATFDIYPGETFGLVGESGCGKSTLGKTLLRLHEKTSGSVFFEGQDLFALRRSLLIQFRRQAQIVFQDPYASLNPRMTAEDIISEPYLIHNLPLDEDRLLTLFHQVNLSPLFRSRFPH